MQVGLRQFGNADAEWFKSAALRSDYSRYGLAKELCERVGWRNSAGQLCLTDAYLALPKLAGQVGVKLPALRAQRPVNAEIAGFSDAVAVHAELSELGQVSVEPVKAQERKSWTSMMHSFHPQGHPQLPGKALKYWIVSECYGCLGGLSFHAASWHEQARDAYIGWRGRARVDNLALVVNNARFLILPEVRVYGLASFVLEAALLRLGADWHQRYGDQLQLAYTYVDPACSGYSYHKAGWTHVGKSSGRQCALGRRKHVYVCPLQDQWRARLCEKDDVRFRQRSDIYIPDKAHWTDIEYGCASTHPDGRVSQRIVLMGKAWARQPNDSTPVRFADEAARKGAYRLLSSDNASMDDILESHRQATVVRSAQCAHVLAVQDTTAVNYDTLKRSTAGLTSIGGKGKGIMAHAQVAFSPHGRVLGVLDIDGEFRSRCAAGGADLKESVRWREGLACAAQLAAGCGADTRVISVSDREGDVWELFELQHQLRDQVGCLVRVNGSRRRKVVTAKRDLVDLRKHVESQPAVMTRRVRIMAQGGKRARVERRAKTTLRICKVALKAPGKGTATVPLTAVSVIEEDPPHGVKQPLNWLLLCSEDLDGADGAIEICQWYEKRWGIEEFFRTLKTGSELHKRQFDDVADLVKCMAFDAITAWRVFDLQRMAKHEPDRLASKVFDAMEIQALRLLLHHINRRHTIRPPPDLTVRQYMVDIGRLAGFSPSKRQPVPGTKKIWQGTEQLMGGLRMLETMNDSGLTNLNALLGVSK